MDNYSDNYLHVWRPGSLMQQKVTGSIQRGDETRRSLEDIGLVILKLNYLVHINIYFGVDTTELIGRSVDPW